MLKCDSVRRRRTLLWLIWIVFFIRGVFYCVQQPMWEGYDEWAHFAYIQHIVEHRRLPARTTLVSDEIRHSLEVVPLPYSQRAWPSPHVTHDAFWQLPEHERVRREQILRRLGSASSLRSVSTSVIAQHYEAQQPPLYYLAMALPYMTMSTSSLSARVLVVRLFSVALASLVIPLGYLIAVHVLPRRLALLLALLLAALPGLFINVCRVGNESLSIILSAAVLFILLRSTARRSSLFHWAAIGSVLGAALLTKAYALAFIPLLPLLAIIQSGRCRSAWRRAILGCTLAISVALVIAGWWYWRSWTTTATLSGEQLDAAASGFTISEKIAALRMINWVTVLDAAAFSHIWVGGWSFIVVRSWMYRVFEVLALVAAMGVVLLGWRISVRIWKKRVLDQSCPN